MTSLHNIRLSKLHILWHLIEAITLPNFIGLVCLVLMVTILRYAEFKVFDATFTRVRISADPSGIGSTLVRIHSVCTGRVLNWNGTVPHRDHLHEWTHLVPDSRSKPYRIRQVPCKHKAYPYQFRTGSKRIRSSVNAA